MDSLFVDLDGLVVPERRLTDEKFVEQDTQRPPINCLTMAYRERQSTLAVIENEH